MRAIIVLFLCTTVLASKISFIRTHNEPSKIVGGTETTIEEYPFGVAMLFSRFQISYTQSCAGSIINNRSILSAGHCYQSRLLLYSTIDLVVREHVCVEGFDSRVKVNIYVMNASYNTYYFVSLNEPLSLPVFGMNDNETNAYWRIRVGSTWANSGGVVFRTELRIVHPNYNRITLDNDIAIVRVSGTIVYGLSVAPASIAGTNYNVPDNESVWAIGWGRIYHGGPSSETLRQVEVWTINHELCRDRYVTVDREVTENMLCSGWLDVGGRDQCNGDSGGPLIHRGVVIGVCSWGNGCADPFFPGVNARVSRFTDWIVSNV